MGAWSEDAFGNDSACDWANEFLESPELSKINSVLKEVVGTNDYLDSDLAMAALDGCEIVARLKGNFGIKNSYSMGIDNWIVSNPQLPDKNLVSLAGSAIDRILGKESELAELWDDGDDTSNWRNSMADLRNRVLG
jgi:hypothetical protein